MHKKSKHGFTLVELLLVVAFITIFGLVAYMLFDKATIDRKANQEAKNLESIKVGTIQLLASQSTTSALGTNGNSFLNNGNIVPQDMNGGGAIISSGFGPVVVQKASLNGLDNGFRITYQFVPGNACLELGRMAFLNFDKLDVDTVVIKNLGDNGNIDLTLLTTACGGNGGNGVDMDFYAFKQ